MKIAFFGASVTQQSTRHDDDKIITGYFNYLQLACSDSHDFQLTRVACPSNTLDDAGIVYLDTVLQSKPDYCFLEWSTPENATYQPGNIEYICWRLCSSGVLPVFLILPRTDRLSAATELSYVMNNLSSTYGFPCLDLSLRYPPDHESLRWMLRDIVHTTPKGGERYAADIMCFIRDYLRTCQIDASSIDFPLPARIYNVVSCSTNEIPPRLQKLNLTIHVSVAGKATLYAEQRLGPWSKFCHSILSLPESSEIDKQASIVSLSDQWTSRERQALKALGILHFSMPGSYSLELIASSASQSIQPGHSEIRIKGNLYIAGDALVSKIDVGGHK